MTKKMKSRTRKPPQQNFKDLMSESHLCVDCGFDTSPGNLNRAEAEQEVARQIAAEIKNWSIPFVVNDLRQEMYFVHDHIWKAAGMEPWGGCLCIGCLEKRIGRKLTPMDFSDHVFNTDLCGTQRLMERRGTPYDVLGDFPEDEEAAAALTKRPCPRKPQQQHAARLLKILVANLERTRDPALRKRLEAALAALKAKAEAA
jgi:hypothetical protein